MFFHARPALPPSAIPPGYGEGEGGWYGEGGDDCPNPGYFPNPGYSPNGKGRVYRRVASIAESWVWYRPIVNVMFNPYPTASSTRSIDILVYELNI